MVVGNRSGGFNGEIGLTASPVRLTIRAVEVSQNLTRRDYAWALLIFVVGLGLRIPFRSGLAYHWDGAQFALALNEYSVALSQPHAPGYFLFVMLGRLVHVVVADPYASVVWVCVVFGSALPAMVSLLGTRLFNRTVGLAAGAFALTSPQVWFHSEIAVTYVVDATLVCLTVLLAWRTLETGGRWRDAVGLGAMLALVGGVRQQTVPLLVPLVVYVLWQARDRGLLKVIVAGAVSVGLALTWFVPTVVTAGGLPVYLEIVRRHGINNSAVTFAGAGTEALLDNVAAVAGYCWNGLMLGALVLVGALVYRAVALSPARRQAWWMTHRQPLGGLVWWLTPMLLWGTVIGFTSQPGYVLGYLPALLILVAVSLAGLPVGWRRLITGLIVAGNVFAFTAWPAAWDGVLFQVGRTARELREHEQQLGSTIALLRSQFEPHEVALIHAEGWFLWGIRHFQLHAPEFEGYQLSKDFTIPQPRDRTIWRVNHGRLEFAGRLNVEQKPTLLLVVPPYLELAIFAERFPIERARPVAGAGGTLFTLAGDLAE